MKGNPLTVVATMKARAGKEEELGKELAALVGPTRREEGCLQYDLHRSQEDPALYLFYENWTDRRKLDAHLNSPHLLAFREKAEQLLAAPVDLKFLSLV